MAEVRVDVRNESSRKGLVRRDVLTRIAERVVRGEHGPSPASVSVLLCDDAEIASLNRQYRKISKATDVLSFEQESFEGPERVLGDIVISLETVERRNGSDLDAMRAEVRLLFCHGLLHLLGHDHDSAGARHAMIVKQAQYLGVPEEAAWVGRAS